MEVFNVTMEDTTRPPEKVLMMYQAVSELIRKQKDIGKLKVADITSQAGIGKGTAYEYFSSKEELIANALMYEYSLKIVELVKNVDAAENFKERYGCILDWIKEYKEYNQMFSNIVQAAFGGQGFCGMMKEASSGRYGDDPKLRVIHLIDLLMENGYQEGEFTEMDSQKRRLAFLATVSQYALVVMRPQKNAVITMEDEALRTFVYESMIKSLS